jgi:hypothetical protein
VPRQGPAPSVRGRDDDRRDDRRYVARDDGRSRGRYDGRYRDNGRTVYVNYNYYPRRYFPFGFGGFGPGYYYYDRSAWYPYNAYDYRFDSYAYRYGYPTGELRLDVEPRHAEVYVDGYYAGLVDDFDGVFQGLRLEEGPYRIEIVAPGLEPLEFDVRIQPGRKINYRGDLYRSRGDRP